MSDEAKKYNEDYIRGKVSGAQHYRSRPRRTGSDRLPPGQKLIGDRFPVLGLGLTPEFNPQTWRLRVYGEVEHLLELTYPQLLQLPKTIITADFHCVTSWSKFDVRW